MRTSSCYRTRCWTRSPIPGAEIDDTPFILTAQDACRQIKIAIERAIDRRRDFSIDDVFDHDYKIVEGSNPVQYDVRFNAAADKLVRRSSIE